MVEDEVVDALLVVARAAPRRCCRRRLAETTASTGSDANSAIFLRMSRRELALGAAEQHVGLDADAAQLVDRVLRRLGLQLARVADVRHEREVDEHAVAPADVDRELADRLEERQRLDVADRAADLGDDDVDVAASRRSA